MSKIKEGLDAEKLLRTSSSGARVCANAPPRVPSHNLIWVKICSGARFVMTCPEECAKLMLSVREPTAAGCYARRVIAVSIPVRSVLADSGVGSVNQLFCEGEGRQRRGRCNSKLSGSRGTASARRAPRPPGQNSSTSLLGFALMKCEAAKANFGLHAQIY
ncbi:hypothetical protein EVAR_60688_1 [Eumeta japonica]|uniref:Uncharacterized protein n=1 Tax=Eumeta variegata TaxID=151549 RepID=A0A4C1ZLD9_EUMVA|nr:hypothetical protein EVAR_60688_1 [Eumeta japonica]